MPEVAPKGEAAKKVWRSGVNPAQVLGRTGMPLGGAGMHLWRMAWAQNTWYLPHHPTWALRDSLHECEIIAKAIAKYGVEATSYVELGALLMLGEGDSPVVPAEPEDVHPYELRDGSGRLVPAYGFGDHEYPAQPVAYLWRRYSAAALEWRQSTWGHLSAWLPAQHEEAAPYAVALLRQLR